MFPKYKKYKRSPLAWIGEIPEEWRETRLKNVAVKLSHDVRPDDKLLICSNKGKVFFRGDSKMGLVSSSDKIYQGVRKGDLLIHGMDTWHGAIAVSHFDGKCTPVVHVCDSSENKQYLAYFMQSLAFKGVYKKISNGVRENTSDFRSWAKAGALNIILPSFDEQNKIVRFLDFKVSEIQRFIHEKKKKIELLNELKHSVIVQAVTNGTDRKAEMKHSSIGFVSAVPAHWDELMLFQVAEEQMISNKDVHHQNLLSLSYGKIKRKDINTKGGLLPASFDGYQIVHNGNVILRLTDLQNDHKSLRVGLTQETGIITSAYTCLKPRDNILPDYLYLVLHAYDVSKVFYGMGGGVRQSIGYEDIRRMTIPLPSIEEQQAIVDYCYAEQEKIETLIAGLNDEIALVQELRIRTISDIVTGKVDVRDVIIPEYEAVVDEDADEEDETIDEEVDE